MDQDAARGQFVPSELLDDGKVVHGKDGWLFVARDTNDVLAQHAGEHVLEAAQLERWSELLEGRRQLLAKRGIEYVFTVAPDTHSVYPDKLPDGVGHCERRPVTQLCELLAERRSEVRPIYPLAEMRAARAERLVCCPTDSHWTDFGAFVAYTQLANELERMVPMRKLSANDVVFVDDRLTGDLGSKLDPLHGDWTVICCLPRQTARLVSDNRVENTGAIISTICSDAPGSCVLLGDSYASAMLPFLAESFGRFTFMHTSALDLESIDPEAPDVVVSLMAERFLVIVPDDEHAPTVATHAARKLASGRARLRTHYWDVQLAPAAEVVDGLREELLAGGRFRDAAILSVVAHGGLRLREISGLRWRNIHEDGLLIPGARRAARAPGPKGGERWDVAEVDALRRDRFVPLSAPAIADLERWRVSLGEEPRPNSVVFPGPDRGRWNLAAWGAWERDVCGPFAAQLGLPELDLALVRHSFGARLVHAGQSEEEIAAQMGMSVAHAAGLYGRLLVAAKT
jgi:alginate O-acetyltransferase complex protein AlgJ